MAGRLKQNLLIFAVVLIAAILRFWNFFDLTFTYDELNAMSRTVFPNFSQLIDYGVKVDSHPSLIQVFMWAWSNLFGDGEASIKFPFVIMGIVAVYLSYSVAKKFFNESCGLIVASFIACLSYTVMYSQIARPYISGMFFGLGLVNAIFNYSKDPKTKYLLYIFIFSELCLYNHHFSACFALFACLSAFLFLPKAHYKNYMLTGAIIVAGYLPELPITYYQLHVVSYLGGLAGVASPQSNYLPSFFLYLLHYSSLLYVLMTVLTGLSVFFFIRSKDHAQNKFRAYCLLLFIAPYLIGFFYSTKVSQVLQYSTLIFGFPYLLMFLFSGLPSFTLSKNILVITLIFTAGIYSLVFSRRHYSYFYKEPFDEMYKQSVQLIDSLKPNAVSVHMNMEPYFHYYYHKKYHCDIKTLPRIEQLDIKNFRDNISQTSSDYIILANPYDEYVHLVRDRFPYLVHRSFSYSMNLYCYSKKTGDAQLKEEFPFVSFFSTKNKSWSVGEKQLQYDSLGNSPVINYTSDNEFGLLFCDTITRLTKYYDEKVNFAFEYYGDSINLPLVCFELKEGSSKKNWMGYPLDSYKLEAGKWNSVYYSVNSEFLLNGFKSNSILNFYVWNTKKSSFRLRNIRVFTTKFNKNLFKWLEPFNP